MGPINKSLIAMKKELSENKKELQMRNIKNTYKVPETA